MSDARAQLAALLQEQLRAYLARTYPLTSPDLIVTALSYEVGRIIGETIPAEADAEGLIDHVAATMKEQVRAHRSGRLRG